MTHETFSKSQFLLGLTSIHLVCFIGLIRFIQKGFPNRRLLLIQVVLCFLSQLSITGGSHRLYCHASYKARLPLHIFYMIFICLGGWGSPVAWIRVHRTHHKFTDTDLDPHDSRKGLWYSHLGWFFEPISKRVKEEFDKNDTSTLAYHKAHTFIHNYFPLLFGVSNIVLPIIGWKLFGKGTVKKSDFVFTTMMRLIVVIHSTASVNSLAHYFGNQPHDSSLSAFDNLLVSLLSWGEGWHNYHHTYSKDYRASAHDNFVKYWNPTHAFIKLMSKFNQVYDLQLGCTRKLKGSCVHCDKYGRKITKISGVRYHVVQK